MAYNHAIDSPLPEFNVNNNSNNNKQNELTEKYCIFVACHFHTQYTHRTSKFFSDCTIRELVLFARYIWSMFMSWLWNIWRAVDVYRMGRDVLLLLWRFFQSTFFTFYVILRFLFFFKLLYKFKFLLPFYLYAQIFQSIFVMLPYKYFRSFWMKSCF